MSYCQFRNTEGDFRQCLDAIGNAETLNDFSPEEQVAAENIRGMCQDYINWYDQTPEGDEDEDC